MTSEPSVIDGLPGSANLCRSGMLLDLVVDDVAKEAMLEEVTLDEQYGIDVAGVGINNDAVGMGTHQNIGGGVGVSLV